MACLRNVEGGETQRGRHTEMSCRALFMAASCLTCCMIAVLGSEEASIEIEESMFASCGDMLRERAFSNYWESLR